MVILFSLFCAVMINVAHSSDLSANGFSKREIHQAMNLHKNWKTHGFATALQTLNCSNINRTHPIFKKRLEFRVDECGRHRISHYCGSHGDANSVIPFDNVCAGHVVDFGNYRVCYRNHERHRMASGPCSVISVGSNNVWDFEIAAHNKTVCNILTIEPRTHSNNPNPNDPAHGPIRIPPKIVNRTTLHQGFFVNGKSKDNFISYENSIRKVGGDINAALELFKIDCEGCEMDVFPDLLKKNQIGDLVLPHQILTEFHVHKGSDPALLKALASIFDLGYVLFDSRVGDGGCEYGFIKMN